MKKEKNNKKFFKNKYQLVICVFLFALFIYGFIYLGKQDYSNQIVVNKNTTTEVFKLDQSVFTSLNSTDAYNILKKKNVIILFGISNTWVQTYAEILVQSANEQNIDTIYYYDIKDDRDNKNATYESIVNYLENEIYSVEGEKQNLLTPTLLIKKNNEVLLFDDSSAIMKGNYTAEEYWDEYNISKKRLLFEAALKDYME